MSKRWKPEPELFDRLGKPVQLTIARRSFEELSDREGTEIAGEIAEVLGKRALTPRANVQMLEALTTALRKGYGLPQIAAREPLGCLGCSIEAEIGTEEDPHPVPERFHACGRTADTLPPPASQSSFVVEQITLPPPAAVADQVNREINHEVTRQGRFTPEELAMCTCGELLALMQFSADCPLHGDTDGP